MLCNSPTRSQRRTTATEIESAEATASATQQAQRNAKIKNMSREYGGQWLSCCTRHVRIYAAYIDPVTRAFDQTQMAKLTLMLDLLDFREAKLTEYTLSLIRSAIEHCVRKMIYNGEIRNSMKAKVFNFDSSLTSNNHQLPNVQKYNFYQKKKTSKYWSLPKKEDIDWY
ncbi:hypothetical protein AAC387_Pa02g2384 [Persea americana]